MPTLEPSHPNRALVFLLSVAIISYCHRTIAQTVILHDEVTSHLTITVRDTFTATTTDKKNVLSVMCANRIALETTNIGELELLNRTHATVFIALIRTLTWKDFRDKPDRAVQSAVCRRKLINDDFVTRLNRRYKYNILLPTTPDIDSNSEVMQATSAAQLGQPRTHIWRRSCT